MRSLDVDDRELRLHCSRLKRLARRLVQDDATADDLVQDTLLVALRSMHAAPVDLERWLSGILRRLALNGRRAERRRRRRERDAAVPETQVERPSNATEERSALMRVLAELEEPYRSTIRRRFLDGASPRQIGLEFELPVRTVHKRISTALALMRARARSSR